MKNNKLRKIVTMSMCVSAVLALTACGAKTPQLKETPKSTTQGETKKGVTIAYLTPSSQANNAATIQSIKAWEDKTGNKIDLQSIPDDQYDSVVTARLGGGDGIDIFQGAFQAHDVENSMIEFTGEDFEKRLSEPVLRSLQYNGRYYGFPGPDGISSFGFFYNKDVFKKANIEKIPTTFDEFEAVCEKIKAAGTNPIFISGKDGWTLLQHRNAVSGTIYQENNKVWELLNKNEMKWTEIPEFKAQYKALESWAKKGYINEQFLAATYEEGQKAVANGESAMLINGSWVVPGLLTQNANANIGFMPLPTSSGQACIPVSGYGGGWHIAKTSKVQEQAKDFLRFMIAPSTVSAYMKAAPGIVAYNDVPAIENSPKVFDEMQVYISDGKVSPHGDTEYIVPMNSNEIIALYQELIAGKITADEFVEQHHISYMNNAKVAVIPGF